jgi:hypothetical protein
LKSVLVFIEHFWPTDESLRYVSLSFLSERTIMAQTAPTAALRRTAARMEKRGCRTQILDTSVGMFWEAEAEAEGDATRT